ncbi:MULTISPECIES: curli assembly protein CsgF [Halomonadaceae]|uniref:Curli production assembly/transport component CsgF n=1 Tax=Modicisalibacter zincidurans TaxID=1178777 RepID=A0ABP9RGN2_9GAMM|nr:MULTISPECIES: curli assembly protein CsgF [Halomonas]MCD6007336.1 curli assembly protein CsgF [Halomonas sp. IOP_31]MEA3252605.1 curli assembly protein CsgF [Pseudomonadota bacterium]
MKTLKAAAFSLLCASPLASAGELIYQPINPSFGGDPFNGSYLLGKAQAQDTNKDPSASRYEPMTTTERLVQSLQSSLVNQLIRDVNSGEVEQGVFDTSEFGVVINDDGGQLSIDVTDKITGDVTTINVGGLADF